MDEIKNSEDLPAITNDFLFHLLIAPAVNAYQHFIFDALWEGNRKMESLIAGIVFRLHITNHNKGFNLPQAFPLLFVISDMKWTKDGNEKGKRKVSKDRNSQRGSVFYLLSRPVFSFPNPFPLLFSDLRHTSSKRNRFRLWEGVVCRRENRK